MLPVRFRAVLLTLLMCCFIVLPAFGQTSEATETPQSLEDINGYQVTFDVDPTQGAANVDDLRAAAEVIARRLEALEVAPYRVQIVNQASIQVQFPGDQDAQSLIDTLTKTALLEFVDFTGLSDKLPQFPGLMIQTTARASVTEGQVNPLTSKPFETVLTGAGLKSAQAEVASYDPNQWVIPFELTPDAGELFGDYTESHIGEPLAIVLDGQVLSVPVIQTRLDTQAVITGNFTEQEAKQLAAQLRAGALILPLTLSSMETVETILIEQPSEDAEGAN